MPKHVSPVKNVDDIFQNFPTSSPSPRLFAYDCGAPWLSGDGRSVSVLCSRQIASVGGSSRHFGPSKDADSSSGVNRRGTHLVASSASLNVHQSTFNQDVDNDNNATASLNRWGLNMSYYRGKQLIFSDCS